jgi:phosphoglycolate phosphatase
LILAKFGLLDFFESIVTRETSLPPFESKAAAAEHMKNSIGVPPSDVVLIGDSVDDAVAAKACGFRFAAAAYGFGQVCVRCPSSVDYVLDEFSSAALLIQ